MADRNQQGPSQADVDKAVAQIKRELESPEFAKALTDLDTTTQPVKKTTLRSDKRKKPDQHSYRFLTYDEVKAQGYGLTKVVDRDGKIADVRITSIKTWKRKATLRVSWKFGMYEYGYEDVEPDQQQQFFIKVLD